jgi:hypothetical protein
MMVIGLPWLSEPRPKSFDLGESENATCYPGNSPLHTNKNKRYQFKVFRELFTPAEVNVVVSS